MAPERRARLAVCSTRAVRTATRPCRVSGRRGRPCGSHDGWTGARFSALRALQNSREARSMHAPAWAPARSCAGVAGRRFVLMPRSSICLRMRSRSRPGRTRVASGASPASSVGAPDSPSGGLVGGGAHAEAARRGRRRRRDGPWSYARVLSQERHDMVHERFGGELGAGAGASPPRCRAGGRREPTFSAPCEPPVASSAGAPAARSQSNPCRDSTLTGPTARVPCRWCARGAWRTSSGETAAMARGHVTHTPSAPPAVRSSGRTTAAVALLMAVEVAGCGSHGPARGPRGRREFRTPRVRRRARHPRLQKEPRCSTVRSLQAAR